MAEITPAMADRPVDPLVDPMAQAQALASDAMEQAEKLILKACQSNVPAVSLGAAHIMRAGGKRLRPLVLILVAQACGYSYPERPARLGAAVELIHTATLVHDDVVDEADTRRGQYSVNIFLGNEASVLMGDYLVCRALRMIADEPDLKMMQAICDVIVSMCEAEVLQITYRGDSENTFENYLRVIRNKTACLFGFTAYAGALLAGSSTARADVMRSFGLNLGIAFQMVDDILDLRGVRQELGKPTGSDLREGKFTYPVLHAVRTLEGPQRTELTDLLSSTRDASDESLNRVVELVESADGFEAAYARATAFMEVALDALSTLPDSTATAGLRSIAGHVLGRRA